MNSNNKIADILRRMERVSVPPSLLFRNKEDLLRNYPQLAFVAHTGKKEYIWHDLEKQATPVGSRNSLNYRVEDVLPLYEEELELLVKIRNTIVLILFVERAARNKKLFLSIIEHLYYNKSLTTGGGTPPFVKRIIMIYEQEGGVTRNKKRRVDNSVGIHLPQQENDHDNFFAPLPSAYDDLDELTDSDIEDGQDIFIVPAEANKPIKKARSLDCEVSLSCVQDQLVAATDKLTIKEKALQSIVYPSEVQEERPLTECPIFDQSMDHHYISDHSEKNLFQEYDLEVY